MAPRHHPASGRFVRDTGPVGVPPRGSTGRDDLGDANPKLPNQSGTANPPSAGSATPGQTGGIFEPAQPGSRTGGGQTNHRLRPAAKSG